MHWQETLFNQADEVLKHHHAQKGIDEVLLTIKGNFRTVDYERNESLLRQRITEAVRLGAYLARAQALGIFPQYDQMRLFDLTEDDEHLIALALETGTPIPLLKELEFRS